jgi:hypothetical protein
MSKVNGKPRKLTKFSDFTPDDRNANKGTERGTGLIEKSLRTYGAGRSILADKHGKIIAGNKTLEGCASIGIDKVRVVETDGTELVVVQRTDLDLNSKAARELAIVDNRAGQVSLEWDFPELDKTAEDFGIDLKEMGFEDFELDHPDAEAAVAAQTLVERFGVPPFSVLDARQGYWQDRKRAWRGLGIQSEIGRGGGQYQVMSDTIHRLKPCADQAAMRERELRASRQVKRISPGGSPRPAMRQPKNGKTVRGDGRGRAI